MLQAHLSKGLRNGRVAPCLFCRMDTEGLCLAILLLTGLLLMPVLLGIGVHLHDNEHPYLPFGSVPHLERVRAAL